MIRQVICLALLLNVAVHAGEVRRVVLRGGAVVEGEILKDADGHVIVDLGVQVLDLPRSAIRRIESLEQGDAGNGQQQDQGIWIDIPGRGLRNVQGNLPRCAPAVVEVRTPAGLGSGFIIHPDGYLITNVHVITGEQEITVTQFVKGEQEFRPVRYDEVRVVALNPHLDLALLKIEGDDEKKFPFVPLGDELSLTQGETVFAIGSPLGLDRTVSQGILSSTSRPIDGHVLLQTTAPINPGNSGGPLFDLRGRVIGVNNMKLAGLGLEGLSFAIPVMELKRFLNDRDAFAFDPRNPNSGFRYNQPPDTKE